MQRLELRNVLLFHGFFLSLCFLRSCDFRLGLLSAVEPVASRLTFIRLSHLLNSLWAISAPTPVAVANFALTLANIAFFLSSLFAFLFALGFAILLAFVPSFRLANFIATSFSFGLSSATTTTRKLPPSFALPFLFSSVNLHWCWASCVCWFHVQRLHDSLLRPNPSCVLMRQHGLSDL